MHHVYQCKLGYLISVKQIDDDDDDNKCCSVFFFPVHVALACFAATSANVVGCSGLKAIMFLLGDDACLV